MPKGALIYCPDKKPLFRSFASLMRQVVRGLGNIPVIRLQHLCEGSSSSYIPESLVLIGSCMSWPFEFRSSPKNHSSGA